MIPRPTYVEHLLSFKDKQLIKIVTGVRRCGKSTLFELYQAELIKQGVSPKQIHAINLEDPQYTDLLEWRKLYDYINTRLLPDQQNYVFIDEVQNVKDFQKAADGLFIKKNVDLYLTGSNSKMQSGEWATLLSGRYVEIPLWPLSFKEFYQTHNHLGAQEAFRLYLETSSFPYAQQLNNRSQVNEYLGGIYHTIVLKDIVENKNIRDIGNLERVMRFMADNIGSIVSVKKISDTLSANGFKIYTPTVQSYLDALQSTYVLYKAGRYDIKGKKYLQSLEKYYLVDIGLRYYLLGARQTDRGRILENIVYLELLRRGSKVYVGKAGEKEVDFVAEDYNNTIYYQVAETVRDLGTLKRELAPLDSIDDHFPKVLLTRDLDPEALHNGIRQINVVDWLLQK